MFRRVSLSMVQTVMSKWAFLSHRWCFLDDVVCRTEAPDLLRMRCCCSTPVVVAVVAGIMLLGARVPPDVWPLLVLVEDRSLRCDLLDNRSSLRRLSTVCVFEELSLGLSLSPFSPDWLVWYRVRRGLRGGSTVVAFGRSSDELAFDC